MPYEISSHASSTSLSTAPICNSVIIATVFGKIKVLYENQLRIAMMQKLTKVSTVSTEQTPEAMVFSSWVLLRLGAK